MWPGPYGQGGAHASICSPASTCLAHAWASITSTSSTATGRPRDPARGNDGRARFRRPPGQGALCGHLLLRPGAHPEAARILSELGTPLLIHQPSYSMLNRWIETELLDVLGEVGIGCIAFSPLAQGMLTSKYLGGIPEGSRASRESSLSADLLSDKNLEHVRALNEMARQRGQTLAQMALAWVLRDPRVTSVDHRRQQRRPARRQPRCAGEAPLRRRGAGPDRRARGRRGHQPVGPVGGGLTGKPP